MKQRILKRTVFIAKSMLWSLLLYVTMMLVANWDDINKTISGKNNIAIICDQPSQEIPGINTPASISKHVSVMKSIVTIMKTIGGFATASVSSNAGY